MTEEKEASWSEMIPDLLESISDRLSLQDYLVFCCVCRPWRFAPSYRSNLIYFRQNKPWLMFYGVDNNDTDKCYLYSHSYTENCQVRVPHLRGATCVGSKSEWLLAKRNRYLFFCNPLTGTKIDLPEYHAEAVECVGTCSLLPTSPHCKIFIFRRKNDLTIEIGSCLVGDKRWDFQDLEVTQDELGGTMTYAVYCCSNDGTCDGYQRVFVRGGAKFAMIYTLADKRYGVYDVSEDLKNLFTYYRELTALHYVNWLEKFGENGISITTSPVQLTFYDPPGYFAREILVDGPGYFAREIQVDGKATTGRRRVKAVVVEPLFKRC